MAFLNQFVSVLLIEIGIFLDFQSGLFDVPPSNIS